MNCAARLILGVGKFDHITPMMRDLHWLPIQFRIKIKVLCLVYKALHGLVPAYLSSTHAHYEPPRKLWSTGQVLLVVPKIRTDKDGGRAFTHTAPFLYDSLPTEICQATSLNVFKGKLKTHLFSIAYN